MKENFGLYLILTDPVAGYEKCAEAAVNESIRYLQLRMKNAAHEEVVAMGRRIKKITAGSQTRLIMNDSIEAAIESDADGIHLGQTDIPIPEARRQWNTDGKIFGLSTHSMEQAVQSLELSPDYIGIGPVFPTQTKQDTDPVVGIEETGRIATGVAVTSVAIGGINADNLGPLLRSGVRNYCVVSAVNRSQQPAVAIRALQAIWKSEVF